MSICQDLLTDLHFLVEIVTFICLIIINIKYKIYFSNSQCSQYNQNQNFAFYIDFNLISIALFGHCNNSLKIVETISEILI